MSDSDVESISPLTSGESEEEDLLEKFESLRRRKLQTSLLHRETLTQQSEQQKEQITRIHSAIGALYRPSGKLYNLVSDVERDYQERLDQTSALVDERESVVRNQQQRLSTLELETDKMRDELQNKLWSLEERHRQALEELVLKDDQYRELQQQLSRTRDTLDKELNQERGQHSLTKRKVQSLTEELNELKMTIQGRTEDGEAAHADAEKWNRESVNWEHDMNLFLKLLNSNEPLNREQLSTVTFRMVSQDAVIGALTNLTSPRYKVGKLEAELDAVQTKLSNREKKVQDLNDHLQQTKERCEKSINELTTSHAAAVRHYEEEQRHAKERQDELLKQVESKNQATEKLQTELQEMHKQTKYLEEQLRSRQSDVECLEKQKGAVETLLETTSQTVEQLKEELEEMQQNAVLQSNSFHDEIGRAQSESVAKTNFLTNEISKYEAYMSTSRQEITLLQSKLEETMEGVTQKEEVVHKLELQLHESQQQQQELSFEMKRRVATINDLTKEVEETRQHLDFAKQTADDINRQLDAYKLSTSTDRSHLEDELKLYKVTLATLRSELSVLQEQHSRCQGEVEHREDIIEQLKSQYTNAENEYNIHKKTLSKIELELVDIKKREADSQRQIADTEIVIHQLNEEVEQLRVEKEKSECKNAGFQSEINSIMLDKQLLEHQQQDCMDKLAHQDEMLGTLEECSRLLEQRYEKSLVEVRHRTDSIHRLEAEVLASKQSKLELEQECEQWKERYRSLEDELHAVKDDYGTIKNKMEQEEQHRLELSHEMEKLKFNYDKLTREHDNLVSEAAKLQGKRQIENEDMSMLQRKVDQLTTELLSAKRWRESKETELGDCRDQLALLSGELERTRRDLVVDKKEIAKKDGELLMLKVNLSTTEKQCETLNDQLTAQEEAVRSMKVQVNEVEQREQSLQFKVSQLQQDNWTLEQRLKSSQDELQAVADVVMDIPNGATARNGSVAATLNIWIRHLKQAVETASKEKEKVENIFEQCYQEDVERRDQELSKQRELIERLYQQVENHLSARRQSEQQACVRSVTIEKIQEKLDKSVQTVEKLSRQLSVLSKENVELRSNVERERAAVKVLRLELRNKEARLAQLQEELEAKVMASPDSGNCDWDSYDDASHSATGSLYANVLRRGLEQQETVEQPSLEVNEQADSDHGILDASYWIDNSSKLQQCSLYYAQEDRRQALELEQLHEQQRSRPTSAHKCNVSPTSSKEDNLEEDVSEEDIP
ncbi:myosin-9-like isoform X2 [Corticium candelabrum]|uniref:myosin-9-like isoform X2 n=1 Tax=Corticium candelabrum TaxID=121492 RepID=UPI002E26C40A|nr:myosin-9-like isoform X2 [Corticium candelabrum]